MAHGLSRLEKHLPAIRYGLLMIALILCLLLGGSARGDALQLLAFRPLMVGVLIAYFLLPAHFRFKDTRELWFLLAAFALMMAVQLLPLPPAIWTQLPGRAPFAEAAHAGGYVQPWHAIALAPDRMWNSLLALLPAAVMLIGVAAVGSERRENLVVLLLLLALASIVLGILQISSGSQSPLYYYQITNRDEPVGFFANRNHQAVFLVASLPFLRVWTLLPARNVEAARVRHILGLGFLCLVVMITLVIGSRSGLALLCLAILGILVSYRRDFLALRPHFKVVSVLLCVALLSGIVLLAFFHGRALSIDRALGEGSGAEESRLVNMPIVLRILRDMLPFGSGFGSFDPVFRSYEPDSLLDLTYFNNAHNDLLEFILTGGLPAFILLGAFLFWFLRRSWGVFRNRITSFSQIIARASSLTIAMLLVASLADYPLRTPLLAALMAIHCVLLQFGRVAKRGAGMVAMDRATG